MGHRSVLCRAGFLLLIPFFLAAAYAQETAVLGPVEQVDLRESSFTVLGQTFALTPSVVVTMGAKRYSFLEALRIVRPGAYVSVIGTETINGRPLAHEVQVSRRPYVPGASDVFISGLATSYDASTGQAKVGALNIDATAAFATSTNLGIAVGSRIEAFGRQANTGGVVWVFELEVAHPIDTGSISGTGNDTSAQSISGTGGPTSKQSISGTGASMQSISGTGTGTSVQSISGTGARTSKLSISGTGASMQSISGTGTGTSVQSISGTGAGTSVRSISGTGMRTQVN